MKKPYNEIEEWLINQISEYTFTEPDEIDIKADFNSFGLSSRDAILLSGDLEEWLAIRLSPTLIYEYPTIQSLSRHLSEGKASTISTDITETQLQSEESQMEKVGESNKRTTAVTGERVVGEDRFAIIGMGFRLPGGESEEQFWNVLKDGIDEVSKPPVDRNDLLSLNHAPPITYPGGFISSIEQFDAQFFNISPREAEWMDPQQRLLAEVLYEAFQDAGLVSSEFRGSNTGVFIGISSSDYSRLMPHFPEKLDAYSGSGSAMSIAANRLSYLFDLHGPSMAIDTACSSSLVAVHLACQSLMNRDCDLAVAGGVNLIISPEINHIFEKAQMLSRDGKCKTFDASADGYVRGEGCGVVVIKRLTSAERDGDPILAIIRGSAINQDGKTNGLTAPSSIGQAAVINKALQTASVSPEEISYVEAHGTGTFLGDQIEAKALGKVYSRNRLAEQPLIIGSVKTNIGHLEAVSGLASLIKVILMMRHRAIPPSINFEVPNPQIDFENLKLSIPTKLREWGGKDRRNQLIAGINSFGFGGTNAHLIVESWIETNTKTFDSNISDKNSIQLFPFSAKSPDALNAYLEKIVLFIEQKQNGEGVTNNLFADLGYSLRVHRDQFEHRLAFSAGDLHELKTKLVSHILKVSEAQSLKTHITNTKNRGKVIFWFGQNDSGEVNQSNFIQNQPNFVSQKRILTEIIELDSRYKNNSLSSEELKWVEWLISQLSLAGTLKSWGILPDESFGIGIGDVAARIFKQELNLVDGLTEVLDLISQNTVKNNKSNYVKLDGDLVLNIAELSDEVIFQKLIDVFTAGTDLHWDSMVFNGGTFIKIPKYQWQHQSYWLRRDLSESNDRRIPSESLMKESPYLFSGRKILTALGDIIYENRLSIELSPWIEGHLDGEMFVLPETSLVDIVLGICKAHFIAAEIEFENVQFSNEIRFPKKNECIIQTFLNPTSGMKFDFKLFSTVDKTILSWNLVLKGKGRYVPLSPTLDDILSMKPGERKDLINQAVRKLVSESLGHDVEVIPFDLPVVQLGLDSIIAVELINKIDQRFNVKLPVSILLQGQTLNEVSEYLALGITRNESDFEDNVIVPISLPNSLEEGNQFPLTPGQRAMWLQHQMNPASVFNPFQALKILTPINTARIQGAFERIVSRHPALRTTFVVKNGLPEQRVNQESIFDFSTIDTSDWTSDQIHQFLSDEAYRVFDLENGPLLRIYILSSNESEHIMLVTAHHLVVDLWSFALLVYDLYQLINDGGDLIELEPLTYKYSDYVAWQEHNLASKHGEKLWDYWSHQIQGSTPVLDLPTDYPRKAIQTYSGATKTFLIDAELTARLKAFADNSSVTLFMMLMAVFKILLFRYSGQEDIIIGTPTTGRTRKEFANVIGYFVNPLPIRSQLDSMLSFKDYLKRISVAVVGALENQEYPFPWLVERLHPERDASILPLFQVMFAFQRSHLLYEEGLSQFSVGIEGLKMSLSNIELESIEIPQKFSQFDLILTMANVNDGLGATITYNTDLYKDDTADRMLGHFETLLRGVVNSPGSLIGDLPLLTSWEKEQIISEWNTTSRDFPLDIPVHKLFEQRVAEDPTSTAINFDGSTLTYEELNKKSNKLARYLKKNGVGKDKIIGVFMDRSPDLIVSILGILKAGGAYVPLDPVHPYERLAFMLQDARVPIVITHSNLMSRIPTLIAKPLFIDTHWGLVESESDVNLEYDGNIKDLAYVIYTSGSTGRSKGVLIEHQGLTNLILHDIEGFRVSKDSRFLQFASIGFDASVLEIFITLLAGATLVMSRREILLSVQDLYRLLDDERVTIALLPPSLLALLPSEGLPHFKMVLSGGESCSPEIAEKWSVQRTFINAYGPTETTVAPTYYVVDKGLKGKSSIPIGKPISNTQIYILDPLMQPVPIGIRGELYIGGIGIARGYLNRPELTEEKFVHNPYFSSTESNHNWISEKLYRTGDLGKFLPDGNIDFIGRIDHQVKVRGFRIELGEIESMIDLYPGISQVVVIVREDKPGEKKLVAYFVPEPGISIKISDIRRYLREKLPEYMIPAFFILLEEFKLNASGKVDRNLLPEPTGEGTDSGVSFVSPKTDLEKKLAEIWQEVLGLSRIGMNDNFFDLGGHSLLMAKAHTKIQESLDREISLITLFQYPTISSLVDYLSGEADDTSNLESVTDRGIQHKKVMKQQSDRMRQIAGNRSRKTLE